MADKMYWTDWGIPFATRDRLAPSPGGESSIRGTFVAPNWEDTIRLHLTQTHEGGTEFQLKSAPAVRWWKSVKVVNRYARGQIQGECQTQDDDSESGIVRLEGSNRLNLLIFAKAKMFGVHTDMYEIPLGELNGGVLDGIRFNFLWQKD